MSDRLSRTAAILEQHYPIELRCDHDAKTDECICSCGTYTAPKMPSIGAAVRTWAEHVAAALDAAPRLDIDRARLRHKDGDDSTQAAALARSAPAETTEVEKKNDDEELSR